jgi:methionine sulfoxide reductase heme-binding subunit
MRARLSFLSPYWIWVLISLPAFGIISGLLSATTPEDFRQILHVSGEFAARFMIISMIATPLAMLLKGWRGPRWLMHNRRYFGVAAFGYATLHLIGYVMKAGSLDKILGQVTKLHIWTGWVAFLIFLPLAATSFDAAVRALGPRWKNVQRWVYIAAVLTFVHWASQGKWEGIGPAIFHFLPLVILEAYRIWYWYIRPRPAPVS